MSTMIDALAGPEIGTGRGADALLRHCGALTLRSIGADSPADGPAVAAVGDGSNDGLLVSPATLRSAVGRVPRIVVLAAPGTSLVDAGLDVAVAAETVQERSTVDPLVAVTEVTAVVVTGPLAGAEVLLADAARLTAPEDAEVLLTDRDGHPLAISIGRDGTTVVVVGSARLLEDRLLTAGRNADAVAWLVTGDAVGTRELVACTVPRAATAHVAPPSVTAGPGEFDLTLVPPRGTAVSSPAMLRAAGHAGRCLPADVHDALVDFADDPSAAGALLLRGLPVGDLPATPPTPTTPADKDLVSEFVLLSIARRLGQPVGYVPEHGGDLVQNILPVRGTESRQVSTSSRVELMFHTEAAFHPHRPRYLLLLCLRGDAAATTTLASIREIVPTLPLGVRRTLFEPRFRTAADESYVGARPSRLGRPMPVLSGTWDAPSLVFDADLMTGVDDEADEALRVVADAVASNHTGVVLEPGDLLVVDNTLAVHGRSPFAPRFDGTDRWLQRTFVVADLTQSAADRDGRIIATRFAV